MIRSAAVAVLLALAVASSPALAQSDDARAILRATAAGDPQVEIRKDSYIAIFEVVPFNGVSQLYPLSTAEGRQRLTPASFTIGSAVSEMARSLSLRGIMQVASRSTVSDQFGYGLGGYRPRFLVLVASDKPLNVDAPNVTMARLANGMRGVRIPWVFSGEDQDIDDLLSRIKPDDPTAHVTVDVLNQPPRVP